MEEFFFDLITILSGIAKHKEEFENFIDTIPLKNQHIQNITLKNGVQLNFHPGATISGRRNMTALIPSLNISITHRFTGHYDISKNYYGVQTFLEKR